jgi:hypothetical protein
MDQQGKDNKSNQQNPNHGKTGSGRDAGYQGNTEKSTMDNKSNQQNPNNQDSKGSKK